MDNLIIKELNTNEVIPYDLLLLADPSKEAVDDYIHRGTCYVASINDKAMGVYVLLRTRPFTIELVNLAIDESYQGKGYAKLLISHAIEIAKNGNHKTMEVGTGNSGIEQLALYQKCGFNITSVDIDFFRRHYFEPIISENGIECRHMIRLTMDL